MTKRYFLGLTGASGAVYAVKIAETLAAMDCELHLASSLQGRKVFAWEYGESFEAWLTRLGQLAVAKLYSYDETDFFASPASGSFQLDAMIIAPCSMATASTVAVGSSTNLIHRAADVQLKERRPLIMVVRETPLSLIHLRTLLSLSEAGAVILPAAPAFYHRPTSVDELVAFIAGRSLAAIGVANKLFPEWQVDS